MSTATLGEYNVIAAFRDLEMAEEALRTLRDEGFVESELSVLGQPAEEVELEDREHETGEPIGGSVAKEVAAGGAAGGLTGGVAIALGAAAVAAIPGVGLAAGTGALIGAVAGAGAGGTVGAILGGEAGLRTNASWTQTLEAIKDGAIIFGVHGGDKQRIDRAHEVLEGLSPMSIHRVNEQGHDVTEGTPTPAVKQSEDGSDNESEKHNDDGST